MSVELDHVSFGYTRDHRVLDAVTTVFPVGRNLLLGPNGAGKSTLLGLIADAFGPHTGSIHVDPVGSASDRGNRRTYRRAVSWLAQSSTAFPGLTAREHVAYAGWLKGLPRRVAWDRAASALDDVDLAARADQRASTLSGGQLRRLDVAGALVSGARWILLDEPTAGLDPAQRQRFARVIQRLPDDVSVIASTHQTEDVESTYDHVTVLVEGRVRYSGAIDEFTAPFQYLDTAQAVAASYGRFVAEDD